MKEATKASHEDSEKSGHQFKSAATNQWVNDDIGQVTIMTYFRTNHTNLLYKGNFDAFC